MTSSPLAMRLAGVMVDGAAELGVGPSPDIIGTEMMALVGAAAQGYDHHVRWPSALTPSGLPFELSVKLGPRGGDIRCVVDVTDHQLDTAGNWPGYLSAGRVAAGAATGLSIEELTRTHLDGVPDAMPSKMMHGLGFGAGGRRRGTLYFRTRWMGSDGAALLPPEIQPGAGAFAPFEDPGHVEVIGFDLEPGREVRAKAYTWCTARSDADLATLASVHQDLASAVDVVSATTARRPPPSMEALFHQAAMDGTGVTHRLFLFAAAWGWGDAAGVQRLLEVVATRWDVSPLTTARTALVDQGFRPHLGSVAIGGDSITFYFWPEDATRPTATPATATASRIGSAARMIRAATPPRPAVSPEGTEQPHTDAGTADAHTDETPEALLRHQDADGLWTPVHATGRLVGTWHAVAALTAALPVAGTDITTAIERSLERVRLGLGATPLPADPLQLAAWLSAWLTVGGSPTHPGVAVVIDHLASTQSDDGTWPPSPAVRTFSKGTDGVERAGRITFSDGAPTSDLVSRSLTILLDRLTPSFPSAPEVPG